jgi:hypothetical protein
MNSTNADVSGYRVEITYMDENGARQTETRTLGKATLKTRTGQAHVRSVATMFEVALSDIEDITVCEVRDGEIQKFTKYPSRQ